MNFKIPKKFLVRIITLVLVCSVTFAYWKVDQLDFLSLDDAQYVYNNPHVLTGFTKANIAWAFSSFDAANWHPLTWLSHMLDWKLYGFRPAGHHLSNVVFHASNTVLVFFVLMSMTGSVWRSALVSALFGLHPCHVESVVWISERKDVLSAFFMLGALFLYAHYISRKKILLFAAVFSVFTLGLMAKPMLVTFPFVLLLLDYWPLNRIASPSFFHRDFAGYRSQRSFAILVIEKIPFFVMSIVSCIITMRAQYTGLALMESAKLPLIPRLYNALVSYCSYIGKMLWPAHLSAYYVHPVHLPLWQAGISLFIVTFVTVGFIFIARNKPYYIVGWLWFLGMLIPVIGIVQVGGQAMADRYTYLPFLGLFMVISWGLGEAVKAVRFLKYCVIPAIILVLCAFIAQTRNQVQTWKNDLTIADHALLISSNNFMAFNLKGDYFLDRKNYEAARENFLQSINLCPGSLFSRMQLGRADLASGRYAEATAVFRNVLEDDPLQVSAEVNCGTALLLSGNCREALMYFDRALHLRPLYFPALYNSGLAYVKLAQYAEAQLFFTNALQIDSNNSEALFRLGVCFARQNKTQLATDSFKRAIALNPKFTEARDSLLSLGATP